MPGCCSSGCTIGLWVYMAVIALFSKYRIWLLCSAQCLNPPPLFFPMLAKLICSCTVTCVCVYKECNNGGKQLRLLSSWPSVERQPGKLSEQTLLISGRCLWIRIIYWWWLHVGAFLQWWKKSLDLPQQYSNVNLILILKCSKCVCNSGKYASMYSMLWKSLHLKRTVTPTWHIL